VQDLEEGINVFDASKVPDASAIKVLEDKLTAGSNTGIDSKNVSRTAMA